MSTETANTEQRMYVIAWENTHPDRRIKGKGKTHFSLEQAILLCAELNEQFPQILHAPEQVA